LAERRVKEALAKEPSRKQYQVECNPEPGNSALIRRRLIALGTGQELLQLRVGQNQGEAQQNRYDYEVDEALHNNGSEQNT
jgi:hypothetical protein